MRLSDFSLAFDESLELCHKGMELTPGGIRWDSRFIPPEVLQLMRQASLPLLSLQSDAAAIDTVEKSAATSTNYSKTQTFHQSVVIDVKMGKLWDIYAFAMTSYFILAEKMPFSHMLTRSRSMSDASITVSATQLMLQYIRRFTCWKLRHK